MLKNFKHVQVLGIPTKVNKEKVLLNIEYFLAQHGIKEHIINIDYIGGCSNHTLKVTIENSFKIQKNILVRLPGSQSELLTNRHAERINTAIVADLGICPAFVNAFAEEGCILQEQGYKVEEFLEGAKSLTHETFSQYRKQALAQLKKVHRCNKTFETEYNILQRIKLMCYTLQDVDGKSIPSLIYLNGTQSVKLRDILKQIEFLERLIGAFGKIKQVPCHNDITPFNFMCTSTQDGKEEIKIIDWEYSGMNDPMFEIAYIANENGYHTRQAIIEILNEYYSDEVISENERESDLDKVLFYLPIVDLKVAIWSLMQFYMRNESQFIEDLRSGWAPERYEKYIEKISSPEYKALIAKLENKIAQSITLNSLFKSKP